MKATVILELRADDAEPILRKAAYEAAKYGAWLDHVTRKTHNSPIADAYGRDFDERRKQTQQQFLAAKRIVEAFGAEYEPTSEEETLTVHHDYVTTKSRVRTVAGVRFSESLEGDFDYDNPRPAYRREVHSYACHAAADRVVRRWRETLDAKAAA